MILTYTFLTMLRLFFILFLLLTGWQSAVQAEEPRKPYKVTRGQQFAVCRELAEILNQPENKNVGDGYENLAEEFVIPTKYKDFRTVEWKHISSEELQHYLYKEDSKATLELLKKLYLKSKVWDGNGEYIFEKTWVNFDNFGPEQANELLKTIEKIYNDTSDNSQKHIIKAHINAKNTKENKLVLRYRFPNWKQWHCQLPDNVPEDYANKFNAKIIESGGIMHNYGCQIFLYKGRTFHTSKSYSDIEVYEPKTRTGYDGGFGRLFDENICSISNDQKTR